MNELHPKVGTTDCTGYESIGPIAGYGPYCYSITFLYFEGAYMVALFGTLFYLMQYNIQKMYGIDVIIDQVVNDWLSWFTTPGISIAEINDTSSDDDWLEN